MLFNGPVEQIKVNVPFIRLVKSKCSKCEWYISQGSERFHFASQLACAILVACPAMNRSCNAHADWIFR